MALLAEKDLMWGNIENNPFEIQSVKNQRQPVPEKPLMNTAIDLTSLPDVVWLLNSIFRLKKKERLSNSAFVFLTASLRGFSTNDEPLSCLLPHKT